MSENPFAQGDYQHSVSVQGTEADNGWVLTKAQWDQVMAALHQHGIMDANSVLDSPHPEMRAKYLGFGGGQGILNENGIELRNPNYIIWNKNLNSPYPTYPHTIIEGDTVAPTSSTVQMELGAFEAADGYASFVLTPATSIIATVNAVGTLSRWTLGFDSDPQARLSLPDTYLTVGGFTSDRASAGDGSIWYRTDTDKFRVRVNGVTYSLALENTAQILGSFFELTISSGAITVTASAHTVDTQSDAASDDLDTISGGSTGQILIIAAANSARTVVAKDGTGNLKLAGDCTLDNAEDTLTLIFNGTNWLEIARSDNGA